MRVLLQRWFVALALVVVTYNPTPLNYLNWVHDTPHAPASLVVLAGAVIVFGFVVFVRSGVGAIGWRGMAIIAAWLALVLWVLVDFELVDWGWGIARTWAMIIGVSLLLALASSWPQLRRAFTLPKKSHQRGDEFLDGL